MSKQIGKAKVISSEEYKRKDGSTGFRVVAMTDESQPVVFYRPAEEVPHPNDEYGMYLGYDNKLSAVVRYQKITPINK